MEQINDRLYSWASDLDPNARLQAERTARMPILAGPLALMPDAHWGMGATVGSVIATDNAVMPAAVGVDIGCGMIAVECPFMVDVLPDNLGKLHGYIGKVVPAGVGQGHELGSRNTPDLPANAPEMDLKLRVTAYTQLGSLGSGNHFVEVCADERDIVWVVLHSGSRGVGNKLAVKHINNAKGIMKHLGERLEDPDLAFLMEGTEDFDAYIQAMLWAQDYAMLNRSIMMDAVVQQLKGFVGIDFREVQRINCHHNFTQREVHNGRGMWITRKGAIQAGIGDKGVIPGSMGTRSYIVSGAGNPLSYNSCSHGAGRRMGRKEAERTYTVEDLRAQMVGKTWNDRDAGKLVDEIPMAYKDIDRVMDDQKDLVTVDHVLHQLLNYKGT